VRLVYNSKNFCDRISGECITLSGEIKLLTLIVPTYILSGLTTLPVTIPSIASPGAIITVVLLTDNHLYNIQQQTVKIVLVLFVVGLIMLILLMLILYKDV